ncbi:MAG: hypothetical protein DSY55_01060 [Clostridia bacterium]|nr:MAG: hypothetical protein DSY55_01060 [Clostridia bacterium]
MHADFRSSSWFYLFHLRRSAFSALSAFYLRNRRHERQHADKDENWMMRGFDSPRMPLILRILTDFY